MAEIRVEENGTSKQAMKVLGIPLTMDLIFKAVALLVTATLLYANMNNNTNLLGVKIDNRYELINAKLENFEWRMKLMETKLDRAEQRDLDDIRKPKP